MYLDLCMQRESSSSKLRNRLRSEDGASFAARFFGPERVRRRCSPLAGTPGLGTIEIRVRITKLLEMTMFEHAFLVVRCLADSICLHIHLIEGAFPLRFDHDQVVKLDAVLGASVVASVAISLLLRACEAVLVDAEFLDDRYPWYDDCVLHVFVAAVLGPDHLRLFSSRVVDKPAELQVESAVFANSTSDQRNYDEYHFHDY